MKVIALSLLMLLVSATSFGGPQTESKPLRELIVGTWEEEFAVDVPRTIRVPEETKHSDTVMFVSRLTFTDSTFAIEIWVAGNRTRGTSTLGGAYELTGDTLILVVSRYSNPPRLTRNPLQITIFADSLHLKTLPQDVGDGRMAIPSPDYPWQVTRIYREAFDSPNEGTFFRVK